MSAYCFAVQIGMPEGLEPDQQQAWLHKWRDGLLAKIEGLETELANMKAENATLWDDIPGEPLTAEEIDTVMREAAGRSQKQKEERAFEALIVATMRGVDMEELDKAITAAEAVK